MVVSLAVVRHMTLRPGGGPARRARLDIRRLDIRRLDIGGAVGVNGLNGPCIRSLLMCPHDDPSPRRSRP